MHKPLVIFSFVVVGIFAFASCKKITQDELVNGLWKLDYVQLDTSTSNYMNTFSHFTNGNGCCVYKMDFKSDNVVLAYYLTYDTFAHIAAGNYSLPDYNKITIKLDSFMDGTFDILKPSTTHWDLTSGANHVKAFDGVNPAFDTTYTSISMEKI